MSINLLIGIGNAGTQIVKAASKSSVLQDVKMFTVDSVANTDPKDSANITNIPIMADDKNGSGRSRERGAAMFDFHDQNGTFDELYKFAETAKSPIIIVTSAAGGTGSGSAPELCKAIAKRTDCQIIPFIICPSLKDPDAFHLNTMDLMLELEEAEIKTYCIFRNEYGTADYSKINSEVVTAIELILGKHFHSTSKDSIDDSDLDMLLSTPGRFIAVEVTSTSSTNLKHLITEKVLHGYQPGWSKEDSINTTMMAAYSLESPFATTDFQEVFSEINQRIEHRFDEYRNICDRDESMTASLIVAGLPRAELKQIDSEFHEVGGIADGIKKASRPAFMKRKSTIRSVPKSKEKDDSAKSIVNWTE